MSQKEVAISLQTCCYSEQLVNFYLDPLYLGMSAILKWYLLRGVTIPSLPPLIYSFSNKPSLQKNKFDFFKGKKISITFSPSVQLWWEQPRKVLLYQTHFQPQSCRIQDTQGCSSSHSWFLFNFKFTFAKISLLFITNLIHWNIVKK